MANTRNYVFKQWNASQIEGVVEYSCEQPETPGEQPADIIHALAAIFLGELLSYSLRHQQ
jgi:hypothetical protein